MAVNPFLRGMTGQQMGVGRKSPADFFTQQASPSMALPVRRPTPPQRLSAPSQQPLDIAGLRRQVLAQAAAPTAPQSRQALMAKYGLAPTAPAPKPSPMQRLSSAMPASGTPQMAGLGAAGRAMLEMSGYQPIAQAPSIGQILARSAEAGIGVMKEQQAAEQARAQAEAQAQAEAAKLKFEQRIATEELKIKQQEEARQAAAATKQKTFIPQAFTTFDDQGNERRSYFDQSGQLVHIKGAKARKPSAFEEKITLATGLKPDDPGFQDAAYDVLKNPQGNLTAEELANQSVREELAKASVGVVKQARADMTKDLDMLPKINQAMEILDEGVKTGKIESALLPFRTVAAELGIADADKVNKQQLLDSVFNYLVPRFRVPGTGATSNLEIELFKGATGSLDKLPGANKYIMQGIKQAVEHKRKYVNEMENYILDKDLGNGSLAGFDEYFSEKFGDQVFNEDVYANLQYANAKTEAGGGAIDVSKFDLDTLENFDMSIVDSADRVAINAAIDRMIAEEEAKLSGAAQ